MTGATISLAARDQITSSLIISSGKCPCSHRRAKRYKGSAEAPSLFLTRLMCMHMLLLLLGRVCGMDAGNDDSCSWR